jgi:uncharacterized Zn finger protein
MSVGPVEGHLGRLMSALCDPGCLVRGRELLEDGQVRDLVIAAERIEGEVRGSRRAPYEVKVWVPTGGSLPSDARALKFSCTCPDWTNPCKHAVAVVIAAAEQMDSDDALLITLLGGDKAIQIGELVPPERDEAAARRLIVATTLAPPTERPAWAQELREGRAPDTLEAWLGGEAPRQATLAKLDDDPTELMLALGPLTTGDGLDLAPFIQLLLYRLREG